MAVFELNKTDNGQFNFSLKSDQGKTLLRSEQYENKSSAQNGIESVRNNAPNEARYELKTSQSGQFYYNLKAGNGQIIGTSVMHADEGSRGAAIQMTQADAPKASVQDNS